LKDDRPFDYADIADIIEAEAYLESIKKKKWVVEFFSISAKGYKNEILYKLFLCKNKV
jgi:hypothetical protein